MIFPTITGFYTAIFSVLLVLISVHVIRQRRKHKVAIGHGGIEELERAMRVHGNFTDYIPFALFLLMLTEMYGAPIPVLHAMGGSLLLGRFLHAMSLLHIERKSRRYGLRVLGMVLTLSVLLGGSVAVFWQLWALQSGDF